ncbi:hypothetical protein [Dishui Lake phycodnavirus 3]|nr:hypothetical protein [Dishui Lake phycodnavirus 3]
MLVEGSIYEPMYEHNDKKYIRIAVSDSAAATMRRMQDSKSHVLQNVRIDDPLVGKILTIKVPFRYRRVMCEVKGKPVQSLVTNDVVNIDVEFMGAWNVGGYSGYSWKLRSIQSLP